LQERNANVVVPGRSVGRQLTSALGVLERLAYRPAVFSPKLRSWSPPV
jgi:hypothetical protein